MINILIYIMFAEYDKSQYPLVKVKFGKGIKDEEDYQNFLREWLKLYEDKKPFYFMFNTTETGLVNIKYAVKTSRFIKKIKKQSEQWLQYSIIIINSDTISFLLKLVFKLSAPVSPVYIVKTEEDAIKIFNYLYNDEFLTDTNKEKLNKINYSFISNK